MVGLLQTRFDGNLPLDNEEFTRSAIMGARVGSRSRSRLVGIGSREHDAFDDFIVMDEISSDDVGLN